MKNVRIPIGEHVVMYQRGKRRIWTAEFHRDGEHCRQSLRTHNKKVAMQRAIRIEHELATGIFKPPAPATTISAAKKQYLEFLTAEGRARKTLVRYQGELNAFEQHCTEHKILRLAHVSPATLDAYRAHRRKTHHVNTVTHETVVILQLFKWAASRNLLSENPLRGFKVGKPVRQARPAPSLAEVQQILAAATPRLRMMLATLTFGGLRAGEMRKLRKEDVDLKGGWLHVVSRPGAETKTKMSRKIPIHPCLLDILQQYRTSKGPFFISARPSPRYPEGGHGISPKKVNEDFQQIAKKLGMTVGRDNFGYTQHSLRRFFETFCVNAGIPQRAVDIWMGHKSDRSMAAVYYALSDADSKAFMAKVPFTLAAPNDTGDEGT